jgi:thiosulfate/3-mercaptopyruvate sulfurtransferase
MSVLSYPSQAALPRGRQLPGPLCLEALLRSGAPVRLFEVGCGGADEWQAGHIPGARYLDTSLVEQAPLWNKVPDPQLLANLLRHGIASDSCVVLYGRHPLAAARVAHLLLYAGVGDVRLLDGGLAGWCAAGLPLETGALAHYPAAAGFGAPFPARPDYLIGMAQAGALLERRDAALVSIRTWAEYSGQTSGYSYIAAKGDIPGARWGRAGADGDINSMSDFQRADGRMRPAAEIAAFWRDSGISREQQLAFYCGTGWRASLAFFYAWVMGWERISVYDGGWYEWSDAMPAQQGRCAA